MGEGSEARGGLGGCNRGNGMNAPEKFYLEKMGEVTLTPVELKEWTVAVDGICIKQFTLEKAGHAIGQHAHTYDHHSMVALGSVRVWADGKLVGDFSAPSPVFIKAGTQHQIMALEDGVVFYCIHNLHGEDDISILAQEG